MKIKSFKIHNYRAIEYLEIKLNYSLNPIIGVNESGKTTILKAILAFDKERDSYNNGEHLDPQNKYQTSDTLDCKVTAVIKLDERDISSLIVSAKVKSNSSDYEKLKLLQPSDEIELVRHIKKDGREYEALSLKLENISSKPLAKYLSDNLPSILYFDDFTDRVPNEIVYPEEYVNTGKLLSRGRIKEWQEIVEEIFKRAEDFEQTALQRFLKIQDRDRKGDVLSDIEDLLNKEIIKEWKKIKKSGKTQFADDSDNLELKIENPEINKFIFKVKDKSNKDKRRTFDVTERSKGFQWFFNYMIKLKFNPRYKKNQENSIFLLDEPGSYLHSSAQSELLKELETVSNKNTIIYCTHSQFLLNPSVVKLGSIKIAEKAHSKISLHDYGSYKSKKDQGALSPVYQALQLNFAQDFIGKIVITEGITDFFFFEMLRSNTDLIRNDIKIVPGSGAGSSSTLISLAISFADGFVVMFDQDNGGETAADYYMEIFGDEIKNNFHFYSNTKNKFRLENFLSDGDKERLGQAVGVTDVKKGLPLLYYQFKNEQALFFSKLDTVTLNNLSATLSRLNEI